MKIETAQGFQPITITIETALEANFLRTLLGKTNTHDECERFQLPRPAKNEESVGYNLYMALQTAIDKSGVDVPYVDTELTFLR